MKTKILLLIIAASMFSIISEAKNRTRYFPLPEPPGFEEDDWHKPCASEKQWLENQAMLQDNGMKNAKKDLKRLIKSGELVPMTDEECIKAVDGPGRIILQGG